jgi:prepilin peptidase CpaA
MILACLLVAITTDLTDRIIPNRLVGVVLACSIALRLLSGPVPLLESLLGALAILVVLGMLASYDLLGWGDVKLIAAVSFAVPVHRVGALLLAITMAGGLLSLIYLAARGALRRAATATPEGAAPQPGTLRRLLARESARIRANEPMPYALAVLGGVAYGLATA